MAPRKSNGNQVSTTNKLTGGGTFDPDARFQYFLASDSRVFDVVAKHNDHILIALNEIKTQEDIDIIRQGAESGLKIFLDSGIFMLAAKHARTHGMPLNAAFAMQPEEVDGFAALLDRYVTLVDDLSPYLWGYVELDLGGADTKRRTRTMLESQYGLAPIPVYHPFGDGWDYFDELAAGYDRICLGNIVQSSTSTRMRMLATISERRQKHPGLRWIHTLGMTPNEVFFAYPTESADSSSWLSSVRWTGVIERAAGKSMGEMPRSYLYPIGNIPLWWKGVELSSYCVSGNIRNWQSYERELDGVSGVRSKAQHR